MIDTLAEWDGKLVEPKYTEGFSSTDLITEAIVLQGKKRGAVIFDEYYSLKYSGFRIAVNEYFERKMVLSRYLKLMKDLKDGVSLLINNKING